jgi:hypothetical protein
MGSTEVVTAEPRRRGRSARQQRIRPCGRGVHGGLAERAAVDREQVVDLVRRQPRSSTDVAASSPIRAVPC